MALDTVPIELKLIVPTPSGTALFLGDEAKTFVIHVDTSSGRILADTLAGVSHERPLTHDLIGCVFTGFGVAVERVTVNRVEDGVFYARLLLSMKNELGAKFVEIDSRPSDALILALRERKPALVTREVLDAVEDSGELFRKLREQQRRES